MNAAGRVSVIMIFLDAERFIEEAIESVFAQTYERWELLLVDDGSTDASTAIAQRFAAREPHRVRYLQHDGHQNLGMSASRNLGLRHASGEFVGLLDADDVWLPEKLERQVQMLREQPEADMVCGPSLHWHSWTGNPDDAELDGPRRLGVRPGTLCEPPQMLELMLRRRAHSPAICSLLIRRRAVEAVGGFEEQFRTLHEDQVFLVKIFLNSRVYVAGQSWDRYRQHPESSCSVAAAQGAYHPLLPSPAERTFLEWLGRYLADQGQQGTAAWRLVRRRLWYYRHPRLHRALARGRGLRLQLDALYWEKLVPLGFRGARRILPRRTRAWLWDRAQDWRLSSPSEGSR